MSPTLSFKLSTERQAVELRQAERAAAYARAWRWVVARHLAACLALLLVGVAFMGLSWHVTDGDRAMAAQYAGALVGWVGPYFVLLALWRRSEN